ncbi:hypothetical protein LG302_08195 [Halomonas organivorans]
MESKPRREEAVELLAIGVLARQARTANAGDLHAHGVAELFRDDSLPGARDYAGEDGREGEADGDQPQRQLQAGVDSEEPEADPDRQADERLNRTGIPGGSKP